MAYVVKIEGLKGLRDAFARSPKVVNEAMNTATKKAIVDVHTFTKMVTPWDTGALRENLIQRFDKSPSGVISAALIPIMPYAIYVHEGTAKWPLAMPPKKPGTVRKFLDHGLKRAIPSIKAQYTAALKKITTDLAK